jgi:flagellar biosynthesis protein FlhF
MQAQGRRTQPEASASTSSAEAGASYRFLVRSAEEAVGAIRKQLGDDARVVSVRAVKAGGIAGLLGSTRLEVIAQTQAANPVSPVAKNVAPESAVEPAPMPAFRPSTPVATYAAATTFERAAATASAPRTPPAESVLSETRRTPAPQKLDVLLRRSGLSEALIARLQTTQGWPETDGRPLHEGLSEVAGQIRQLAATAMLRPLPARAAFIGLPGVGCTTALCKWLSTEVFTHGRRGTVASVEFDQPKGVDDLAVFAELLGADFTRAVPAPTAVAEGNFCYVDMPSLSLTRAAENARLRAFLDEAQIAGRVLVVSGLYDSAVLRQACTTGLEVGCTHVIFTQLDELPQWGKLWDFLIEAPLAPLLATLGPSLSGECENDVVGAVLRRTFPWN